MRRREKYYFGTLFKNNVLDKNLKYSLRNSDEEVNALLLRLPHKCGNTLVCPPLVAQKVFCMGPKLGFPDGLSMEVVSVGLLKAFPS